MDLSDLITKLEAATEGSRQLDAEIEAALHEGSPTLPEWAVRNFPVWRARPDGRVEAVQADGLPAVHWTPREYTDSVDAALTLVPEGHEYMMGSANLICRFWAEVVGPCKYTSMEAPTQAIALCIAALRARAHLASTSTAPNATAATTNSATAK